MSDSYDVAVEIGGTKLQWGVGRPGTPWAALQRRDVIAAEGAEGILQQIETGLTELARRFAIRRIGVGFGGPVEASTGRIIKSHQIRGWDDFELAAWFQDRFGLEAHIANDCDTAALGEAVLGAGRGKRSVFYVTVGSGIGGGLVLDGSIYGAGRPAAAEIGHLRPGPKATDPRQTVESVGSGWGLVRQLQAKLANPEPTFSHRDLEDLRQRGGKQGQTLDAKMVADAAGAGNELARQVIGEGVRTVAWAIGQVITLLAPEIVVVGGGVSLMPDALFWQPLRQEVSRYVFPPLRGACELARAALGEEVVLHGALLLADRGAV